jgi:glycosyltransferase involved in cell wall biosynthesis
MNENPTVSVIIPTYLRTEFLKIALESVKNQTEKPNEVIIVDDNIENDLSKKVEEICSLFKNYLNIHIVKSYGVGGAKARNIGSRIATCNIIAFLDDDDYWLPQKIELQKRHFLNCKKNCVAVFCLNEFVFSDYKNTKKVFGQIPKNPEELLFNNTMPNTSSVLIKKDVFEVLGGFDHRLRSSQERDLWLRILMKYPVCLIPYVMCVVNKSINQRESITWSRGKIVGERQFTHKWKNHPALKDEKKRKKYWSSRYLSLAGAYRSLGVKKRAIFALQKSLYYEFTLKKYIRLLYWRIGINSKCFIKLRLLLNRCNI